MLLDVARITCFCFCKIDLLKVYLRDMADNYLEKRFEEFEKPRAKTVRKGGPSLDTLLVRNRSTRGFSHGRIPSEEELRQIVAVNTRIASSKNQQALRFKLVTGPEDVAFVNENFLMGALFRARKEPSNPDCPSLPLPGTEPQAFIIVYGTHPEDASLDIDLGISLQSMSLKAVELGFNCLMIRAFNREAMLSFHGIEGLTPLAVLAVGKSAEKIFLDPVEGGSLDYFRRDGIHYVPKLNIEKLLL